MFIQHEPGGCECQFCGAIFIGQPADTACDSCANAMLQAEAESAQREEWRSEMKRDAFGDR